MGVMFELPMITMILTKIGILTPEFLTKKRKIAIVLIWVLAAIITPGDGFYLAFLAIPIMLLYEISVIVSKIIIRRKRKREKAANY